MAHWDGDEDYCGPTCDGPHYGQELAGKVCPRCGGSASACFTDTAGKGCREVYGPGARELGDGDPLTFLFD